MSVFDSAVFDSLVFDTGSVVPPPTPAGGGGGGGYGRPSYKRKRLDQHVSDWIDAAKEGEAIAAPASAATPPAPRSVEVVARAPAIDPAVIALLADMQSRLAQMVRDEEDEEELLLMEMA